MSGGQSQHYPDVTHSMTAAYMCQVPSLLFWSTEPPQLESSGSWRPASAEAGSRSSRWHCSPVHPVSQLQRPPAHRPWKRRCVGSIGDIDKGMRAGWVGQWVNGSMGGWVDGWDGGHWMLEAGCLGCDLELEHGPTNHSSAQPSSRVGKTPGTESEGNLKFGDSVDTHIELAIGVGSARPRWRRWRWRWRWRGSRRILEVHGVRYRWPRAEHRAPSPGGALVAGGGAPHPPARGPRAAALLRGRERRPDAAEPTVHDRAVAPVPAHADRHRVETEEQIVNRKSLAYRGGCGGGVGAGWVSRTAEPAGLLETASACVCVRMRAARERQERGRERGTGVTQTAAVQSEGENTGESEVKHGLPHPGSTRQLGGSGWPGNWVAVGGRASLTAPGHNRSA